MDGHVSKPLCAREPLLDTNACCQFIQNCRVYLSSPGCIESDVIDGHFSQTMSRLQVKLGTIAWQLVRLNVGEPVNFIVVRV